MSQFLQATVYGLLQGGLLALVAIGFSLVWGVMNIVNLSHGALVVIGAYVAWELHKWIGLDPFLAVPVCAASLFILGYAIQRWLINLIVNAPVFLTLLLTFGLQLLLVNGLLLVFSADYRSIQTPYGSESFVIGDVHIPYGRLFAFGLAILVSVGLVLVMTRTRLGLAISATGMDRGAARLMGIPARQIYALTFGMAAALAGAAGAMMATVNTFSPASAPGFTLYSFVIAVLGGLGNMYGALAGGILLGLAEAWGGQYLPGTLVNAIAFGVLVLTLIIRPAGLLGRAYYGARQEV